MSLKNQARSALERHYSRKGLTGEELTVAVERQMVMQFKPLHVPASGLSQLEISRILAVQRQVRILIDEQRLEEAKTLLNEVEAIVESWQPVRELAA